LRIFNFSTDLGQIQKALEYFNDSIPWLSESRSKDEKITKKDFLIDTISAINQFICHKIKLDVSMFSSRDRDEIFMQIFTNEEWLRIQAEALGYRI